MTFFCPFCWKTIPAEARVCPFCGGDMAAAARRSYPEKLINSLRHPEAETRQRAAEILGELKYAPACEPLLSRAREELAHPRCDTIFLAVLLWAARQAGAARSQWLPLVEQSGHSRLRQWVEDDRPFHRRKT